MEFIDYFQVQKQTLLFQLERYDVSARITVTHGHFQLGFILL